MIDIIPKFVEFINSDDKYFYITGQAGTGKTTILNKLVQYCIDNGIDYTATAFTHKAVDVLVEALPLAAEVTTLHRYLKKVPVDNDEAVSKAALTFNKQIRAPDKVELLFVDEYSMIGSRDKDSLDNLTCKIVLVGDCNQLLPVNDRAAVEPQGKFNIRLTEVFRQASDSKILDALTLLNDSIKNDTRVKLEYNQNLLPCIDYKMIYNTLKCKVLTYTNKNVEFMNQTLEGRILPVSDNLLFCPNNNRNFVFVEYLDIDVAEYIINNQDLLENLTPKLRKLLKAVGAKIYRLRGMDGIFTIRAAIFGHSRYMELLKEYTDKGIAANKGISVIKGSKSIGAWSVDNHSNDIAKNRNRIWREYFTIKENVACLDFNHCITIHKSQGSTFDNVIIDHRDMEFIKQRNYNMYKRLMYVAISRATNNAYIVTD